MPKRTAQPTERQHQVALIQYARIMAKQDYRWGLLVAIPNEGGYGYHNIIRGKMRKAEGMVTDFPDLVLFHQCGPYHGLIIEMKRDHKSKKRPGQKWWIKTLNDEGYCAMFCHGFDEAKAAIETYLGMEGK